MTLRHGLRPKLSLCVWRDLLIKDLLTGVLLLPILVAVRRAQHRKLSALLNDNDAPVLKRLKLVTTTKWQPPPDLYPLLGARPRYALKKLLWPMADVGLRNQPGHDTAVRWKLKVRN